jgi:endonuclease/exonuclease/phosphatase family metal-dependent hydrolase
VYSTGVLSRAPVRLLAAPLLCLVGACTIYASSEPPAANGPPECGQRDLVVATYNVRFDTRRDRENRWSRRRKQVGEQIAQLGADLIGLQEVLANQLDDLVEMMPGYAHEGVGRDDGQRGGEFSPLFYSMSRFERVQGGTFWLSPTPSRPRRRYELKPWGSWHNRIASWALLREIDTGLRFLVVNTHLDHFSERARRESARMLINFIRRNGRAADHVILMGDLNSVPGSHPYEILTGVLRDAMDGASSVKRPSPYTSMTRWTALDRPGHHIDHILVSPGLEPRTYEIVDRRFAYSGGEYYTSDHLPVRSRFCVEMTRR